MTQKNVIRQGRIPRWTKLAVMLIACFILGKAGTRLAIYLGYYREVPSFSGEMKYYSFSPEEILSSLDSGKQDYFFPISEETFFETPLSLKSIHWSYKDQLRLVAAFHQFVWKEALGQEWLFDGIELWDDSCDSIYTFEGADFGFHKREGDFYVRSKVSLSLPDGAVQFSSYRINYTGGWKGIDIANIEINTADKAVNIAEEHGGRDFRFSTLENCHKRVSLAPYGFEHDFPPKPFNRVDWAWTVTYYGENRSKFDIDIDPYSGEYKIIDTNK